MFLFIEKMQSLSSRDKVIWKMWEGAMRMTFVMAVGLVLASAAWAHEGVKDPDVKARMKLMMQMKAEMGVLGKMANGAEPFDAARAHAAKEALRKQASEISPRFETPADDPKSEALLTIWTSWPEFTSRGSAMQAAFTTLNVEDLAALQAGLAGAGNTCRSCHQSFREKTK